MGKMEEAKVSKVDVKKVSLIKTENGNDVNRKCMHMMGGRLCFCQFMEWIDSPKYHCHPQESMFNELQPIKKEQNEKKVSAAKLVDYDNEIIQFDEGWDAEKYFDANYDAHKEEYAYDYDYYFGES